MLDTNKILIRTLPWIKIFVIRALKKLYITHCHQIFYFHVYFRYLKAAKQGDKIIIDAITKKAGNSLAFLDVQIKNSSGDLIATGTHTKFIGENLGGFKYDKSKVKPAPV